MFEPMLEFIYMIVDKFGYLGVFLGSFISSATFFFPIPSHVFVFIFSGTLYPVLVALFASFGSTFGEFTGYAIGAGSRIILKKKYKNILKKWEKRSEKYSTFLLLVLFAATPLPDDVLGTLSGIINYSKKKFFVAVLIGKMIMHLAIAYSGNFFMNWIF